MLDGGMVDTDIQIRVTEEEWVKATPEQVASLRNLRVYPNQQYRMGRDFVTWDTVVEIRYWTPCITTLKELK